MLNLDVATSNVEARCLKRDTSGSLLTVLMDEEFEQEVTKPGPVINRRLHKKVEPKKFKGNSRKGKERVKGFANFYFSPNLVC